MRFLRRMIDGARRHWHAPGGRLHRFWPLFDAPETFLLTPGTTTGRAGPHVRDYVDLKRVMWTVIIALLPCLLWAIYNNGWQHFHALASLASTRPYAPGWLQALVFGAGYAPVAATAGFADHVVFGLQRMLPILVVSYSVGLAIEALFSVLRKEEISEGYLVTGMLIALIVPASIPLWQLALGVVFTVVLVKEVFGGTGMNVFNPAMMARAFLFFAFPAQMSGDFCWVAGNDALRGNPSWLIDGYTRPTPLAAVKPETVTDAAGALHGAHYTAAEMFLGLIPGSAGETSKLCILIGALVLVVTGIGSWRVMLGGVLGLLGSALLLQAALGSKAVGTLTLPVADHLLAGGFLFGIVFMATDPVSSPETRIGKWIYGVGIGVVTILVRAINPAYPEGTMLSVLLWNAFAPGIDHFVVAHNIRRRRLRLGH